MSHLGSVPSGFGGNPESTVAKRKHADLGGVAGFGAGKLAFPKKKVRNCSFLRSFAYAAQRFH
jgi:hypothetical protein